MSAPNVVSVAVIVGVIALCEGLADTLPILGAPWVPFAVVVLAAIVKALQVIVQQPVLATRARAMTQQSPLRRWLTG